MTDQIWTVDKNGPYRISGHAFFTQNIDYDAEGPDRHWSKIKVYDISPGEAVILALAIALALNERKPSDD